MKSSIEPERLRLASMATQTMQALVVAEQGVLQSEARPRPEALASNAIVVKVHAVAVNPSDVRSTRCNPRCGAFRAELLLIVETFVCVPFVLEFWI